MVIAQTNWVCERLAEETEQYCANREFDLSTSKQTLIDLFFVLAIAGRPDTIWPRPSFSISERGGGHRSTMNNAIGGTISQQSLLGRNPPRPPRFAICELLTFGRRSGRRCLECGTRKRESWHGWRRLSIAKLSHCMPPKSFFADLTPQQIGRVAPQTTGDDMEVDDDSLVPRYYVGDTDLYHVLATSVAHPLTDADPHTGTIKILFHPLVKMEAVRHTERHNTQHNTLARIYNLLFFAVGDWDSMEKLWDYALTKRMNLDPSLHPLLLTEPTTNTKENRCIS